MGIFGAPFTGGASLALTAIGVAATGGGVATNFTTDLIEAKKMKKIIEALQEQLETLNRRYGLMMTSL